MPRSDASDYDQLFALAEKITELGVEIQIKEKVYQLEGYRPGDSLWPRGGPFDAITPGMQELGELHMRRDALIKLHDGYKKHRSTAAAPKRDWLGTRRALADWWLEPYRTGNLKAKSEDDALKQATEIFLVKGKPVQYKSLKQNLRNRIGEGGKKG